MSVPPDTERTVQATPGQQGALLWAGPSDPAFADCFDRIPFEFHHGLHRLAEFEIGSLLRAAERMSAEHVMRSHYESGEPGHNSWFGTRTEDTSLAGALADVEIGKRWIILKGMQADPVYRAILMSFLGDLATLTGSDPLRTCSHPTLTIFVTSPGRVTPYHMDGETNFLAQVRGSKDVALYDPARDRVLSAQDLERYWTGGLPKIELPSTLPDGHWRYRLQPGTGVFNPATFPHWLQNGPEVSVSVSINYRQRHDPVVGAHRANHYLRRLRLHPTPVGTSPALDSLKEATFGRVYETTRRLVTAARHKR